MRLYDTARREVVPFEPGPEVLMYTCGITPYDATHLGHAATYVAFDLLNRAWRDAGLAVTYVQNVTDVDDPLWRLPLWDPYADMLKSDVADINNAGDGGFAGAIG